MIKPEYSVSFLLPINSFVWQNVLYFLDAPRITNSMKQRNESMLRNPGSHYQVSKILIPDIVMGW